MIEKNTIDSLDFLVGAICSSNKMEKLMAARQENVSTKDIFDKNDNAMRVFSENELNMATEIKKFISDFHGKEILSQNTQTSKEVTENDKKSETNQNPIIREISAHLDTLAKNIDSQETHETVKQLFKFIGSFHKYSAYNNLWLLMQATKRKTTVEKFGSFKTWTSIKTPMGNVKIKAGEKGYNILVPVIVKSFLRDKNGDFLRDENGFKIPELDKNGKQVEKCVRFNIGKVFDINQTNAKELGIEKQMSIAVDGHIQPYLVNKIIANVSNVFGVIVKTIPGNEMPFGVGGSYNAKEHTIKLNSNLPSDEARLAAFLHECGHMALHKEQLLNGTLKPNDMIQRSAAEGEAEAFAYALSNTLGVKPKSEIYIAEWGNTGKQLKERIEKITQKIHMFISLTNIDSIILQKQKNENKKTQAIEHTTDEENFSIKNTI